MNSITLDAPAKINLYLDVLSKRADGYHNIVTVFQKIDLCDKIKVTLTEKKTITLFCKHPQIPKRHGNLAYKAARLMMKEFNLDKGVRIEITKKIPVAAGLGGGSSDAASVILAIRKLFNLKIANKRLISLAKKIGADVPFFVSGYNCAIATGIGDVLKKLNNKKTFYLLLLLPSIRIYTKSIYNRISFPLTKPPVNVNMIARILSGVKKSGNLANSLYNRLEKIVFPIYPIVNKGKETLSLYAEGALLSGSGPSIYAIFNKRKEAMRIKERIKRDGKWQLFLTKTS